MMRTYQYWLVAAFFVASIVRSGNAQKVTIQSYVQHTVMGIQKGFGIRSKLKKGFEVGVAHQANMFSRSELLNQRYPFTGAEVLVPISQGARMQLYFNTKTGFVNKHFFAVLPEVESRVKIARRIHLGFGAGIRAGQASSSFKILLDL
ncbi:MAG: hypothetical protein AAF789_03260 [Bacteroidota bacterium]